MSEKSFFELPSVYYFRRSFPSRLLYKEIAFAEFENALQSNLNQRIAKKFFSTFEFKRRVSSFWGEWSVIIDQLKILKFAIPNWPHSIPVLFEKRGNHTRVYSFRQFGFQLLSMSGFFYAISFCLALLLLQVFTSLWLKLSQNLYKKLNQKLHEELYRKFAKLRRSLTN